MFVRHVHMHQCETQLRACGAVPVAGMLLGQGCFERQVEICLHEVVSSLCAGPGVASVLTGFALPMCDVFNLLLFSTFSMWSIGDKQGATAPATWGPREEEPEIRGEVHAEEMGWRRDGMVSRSSGGKTHIGQKCAKGGDGLDGCGKNPWGCLKLTINSPLDGAHTLTCALMLLNTDLHGHVS